MNIFLCKVEVVVNDFWMLDGSKTEHYFRNEKEAKYYLTQYVKYLETMGYYLDPNSTQDLGNTEVYVNDDDDWYHVIRFEILEFYYLTSPFENDD